MIVPLNQQNLGYRVGLWFMTRIREEEEEEAKSC